MKITNTLLSLAFLIFYNFGFSQSRGDLISDSLLVAFNHTGIIDLYEDFGLPQEFFPIEFDSIEIHKLVYRTIDAHGNGFTEASGLVSIPVGMDCDFPLLNYNHGTLTYDQNLSELKANHMQHFVGVPFAANGYVTVLPDYLGYGATPLSHPHAYLHAKSEATAVVDMMRAAKTFCSQKEVFLNGQTFLLGYSHGGHVTMATHREMQEFHSDEFDITASSPCSGAYDVSGIQLDSMIHSDFFSTASYMVFTINSFQYIYGNIYNDISDAFVSPWDSLIPLMMNRENPQSFWLDSLPTPGHLILQSDYLNDLRENQMHPLRVALRANDLYDWLPLSPLRMYYCEGDNVVPYINALFTRDHMINLGASEVSASSSGPDNDHLGCAIPAIVSAKFWFDSYREECSSSGIFAARVFEEIKMYPNPFSGSFHIDASALVEVPMIDVRVYDLQGRQVYANRIIGGDVLKIEGTSMTSGSYVVRLMANGKSRSQMVIKVN